MKRIQIHRQLFFLFWLILTPLYARKSAIIQENGKSQMEDPWFTGPLLAPSGSVVPIGHFNLEPYIYIQATTGSYDENWNSTSAETVWQNSFQPILQAGLTPWMQIQIAPILQYNYKNHAVNWEFGDFPVALSFKLLAPSYVGDLTPFIKLAIQEIFPTGNYRNLNPKKQSTASSGQGSFQTQFGVVVGQLIHLSGIHFATPRLSLLYTLPAPTHLKGFNTYGGGFGTNARYFPAQTVEADFGVEINITRRIALACDLLGIWGQKSHFSGNPGKTATGEIAPLGTKNSVQYSLAPALEYNWNDNLGVIGGGWFTFAGKNAPRFWSAVFAVNYYQ